MVITVGGIKGGTGKTTIATNLAVMRASAGRRVLLIDADEQRSASQFADRRNEREDHENRPSFTLVRLTDTAVRSEGIKLAKNYDDVIVDTGGRDTRSQRAALSFSDKLLVPVQPRAYDIWSVDTTFEVANEMRMANPNMRVCCFINCADARGRDNADTAELLKQQAETAEYLDAPVVNRKVFGNSANDGLSVVEMHSDPKATEEIQRLYNLVFEVETTSN